MTSSNLIDRRNGIVTREAGNEAPGLLEQNSEEVQYSVAETHDELKESRWPGIVLMVAIWTFIAFFLWLTKAHEIFRALQVDIREPLQRLLVSFMNGVVRTILDSLHAIPWPRI